MTEFQELRTFTIKCPNPDCPDPTDVRRNGFEGEEQVYRCNTCDKSFTADGKAMYKQFTAKQMATVIDAYFSEMSYKQTAEHLSKTQDIPQPSKRTVHDWTKAKSDIAYRFLKGEIGENGREDTATGQPLKARVGTHWVADETYVSAEGQQAYLWNVMDSKTRYILAAHLSERRDTKDAIRVMEKALAAAEKPPERITTDQYKPYDEAIKTVFPRSTKHIKSQGMYSEINNNISERLQGTFKSRTKTQRGLEAIRTGQDFINGFLIDYNWFREHEALGGRTPAEAAGIADKVPWGDSWEGVVRMGGEICEPQNVTIEPIKRKPGPKPQGPPTSLKSAAEEFALASRKERQADEAKTQYKNRDKSPIDSVPSRRRQLPRRRGRGRMRL